MTPEEFREQANGFEGTSYVCFELNGKLLAIGRMSEGGPVEIYDRDYAEAGMRRPLAEFESEETAAEVGAFIGTMGEATL